MVFTKMGRLEVLGPGATAAAGRRWQAAELERCWRREERVHTLATAQGWSDTPVECISDGLWQAQLR